MFQRALDVLLSAGPPARRAVLAGPGVSVPDADADILLVPAHPATGEVWAPADPAAPADPGVSPYLVPWPFGVWLVPLPFGVWLWLAFPEPHCPSPRREPCPTGSCGTTRPCHAPITSSGSTRGAFRQTLVRLPSTGATGAGQDPTAEGCGDQSEQQGHIGSAQSVAGSETTGGGGRDQPAEGHADQPRGKGHRSPE